VIDACDRPPDRGPGHPPTETIRAVATLRRFLREGSIPPVTAAFRRGSEPAF
jgi:hypothetical protein